MTRDTADPVAASDLASPAASGGLTLEKLAVGQSAEQVHKVGPADIAAFADVSGDRNPLHMDEAYAQNTPFRGRVAPGMLLGAWISALLGDALPGPGAIYVSQSLAFRRPVRIGDEVSVRVEVAEVDLKAGHARMTTRCTVAGRSVLDGEAIMRVRRGRPRER
jgi:3-hydroxybutyryl-CoA dehydratase